MDIEILDGNEKEQLTEIYKQEIYQEIDSLCMENNINIDDVKKGNEQASRLWTFLLSNIGRKVFKGTDKLKNKDKSINGFYNTYDIELLDLMMDFYFELCSLFNKSVEKIDYCMLLGLSKHLFDNSSTIDEILNSRHLDLNKKLYDFSRKEYEKSFKNSNQAIKNIAIANYQYKWNENTSNQGNVNINVKLESLPRFSIDQKGE